MTLLMTCTTALAELVKITLDLNVHTRAIGDWPYAVIDQSFVPYNTTAVLIFDATWRNTDVYERSYGQHTEVFFVGGSQFFSPITVGLPWGPPDASAANRERNNAAFIQDHYDPPEDGIEDWNGLYFDDRYYYADSRRDYRYGVSLEQNSGPNQEVVQDPENFRTTELLQYLLHLQSSHVSFTFGEGALIYDYQAHRTVDFVQYEALAYIGNIEVVPIPAAAWLLASSLSTLIWARRRAPA